MWADYHTLESDSLYDYLSKANDWIQKSLQNIEPCIQELVGGMNHSRKEISVKIEYVLSNLSYTLVGL